MKRIMIAGTNSGCGKTTVTCALLQALVNRKIDVSSFKCGPDYIDPMFHSRIIGTKSRNLDSWFCNKDILNYLIYKNSGEISVIESVMGFYDGVNGKSSSCQTAVDTSTQVVIVIDCKGMSSSIGAIMKGFLTFRTPNNICGFIFNRLPESLVSEIKKLCLELDTEYLGRMPYDKKVSIESRHLGLFTASEISDIKEKMQILSGYAEKHINIDKLLEIADMPNKTNFQNLEIKSICIENPVKIAVADDNAFCFIYEDNLELLRKMGCEIVKFSPLNDNSLPDNISGVILCGGYPELYAQKLSQNSSMLFQIKNAIIGGIPTIAECGGFMYLHNEMKTSDEKTFKMVGVIDGTAYETKKLQRFGYTFLTAEHDNMLCKKGKKLLTHEFHYWDSTNCGSDFVAQKARNNLTIKNVHANNHSYFGFPHLYFYGNIEATENFVDACIKYKDENEKN